MQVDALRVESMENRGTHSQMHVFLALPYFHLFKPRGLRMQSPGRRGGRASERPLEGAGGTLAMRAAWSLDRC